MFKLTVMSFGFKHGFCDDVNILYDVRGFKNPYYVDELKDKTGLDDDVYEYVFSDVEAERFFMPSVQTARIAIDKAIALNKEEFILAYACTGGRHRSVSFARRAKKYFSDSGYNVVLFNRDCDKL
ncbi:MAG: hypothetical protein IJA55_01825 [Clostridia bacterium]|nr:hypothetical protein [Clostridia bacterium]